MFCFAAVLNCFFTMVGSRVMWEISAGHGGGCVVCKHMLADSRFRACTLLLFALFPFT